MAKRNGGIIGPSNVPTGQYGGVAPGVWRLRDAFNYIKAGLWPVAGNYPVGNSLRFNSGSSDYLSRTPASTANANTYTFSTWVKKSLNASQVSGYQSLLSVYDGSNYSINIAFGNGAFSGPGDYFEITYVNSSYAVQWGVRSNALYRDVSAWYHLVVAVDTTQATASNRVKLYVNGEAITTTATSAPSQNTSYLINTNLAHNIGRYVKDANSFVDGYLAETYMIGGQQLTPSSFGQTDSATGIWTPSPYTGTYGTNGFYLKFANSAALGTDSSGNGNTFTVNNLTSVDQSTDTPTNNWNTLNPLSSFSGLALSEGNLKIVGDGTGLARSNCTFGLDTGKWYFESKLTTAGSNTTIGIGQNNLTANYPGQDALSYAFDLESAVRINNNSQPAYGSALTTNDIFMCAFDLTNSKIFFGKNGTWFASSDPVAGTSPAYTLSSGVYNIITRPFGSGATVSMNFGAGTTYAGNSYTDAAGYGNFSYAVPSGYYSLNTKNLANFG